MHKSCASHKIAQDLNINDSLSLLFEWNVQIRVFVLILSPDESFGLAWEKSCGRERQVVDGEEHPSLRGELALPPRARVSAHHLLVQVREMLLEPSLKIINLDKALSILIRFLLVIFIKYVLTNLWTDAMWKLDSNEGPDFEDDTTATAWSAEWSGTSWSPETAARLTVKMW